MADATTDETIAKANAGAMQAKAERVGEEKIAKSELKRRKAEEIKNIPAIPLCPGAAKIGALVYCNINDKEGPDKAVAVWSWWHRISQEFPDRLACYVQRLFPVKVAKERGERSEETFYGFPPYEFVDSFPNLEAWILQRYGSGNYRIWINDSVLRTNMVQWTINGIWDEKFPPLIELAEVDLDNPNNKGYVADLRRRKLIAGYEDTKVAVEATVQANANAAAQQQAQQPLTAAIQTIASMAREQRQNQPDPSVVAESISRSYSKVVDVAMDAMQRTREMEVKGKDPGDHVDQLVKVAKLIAPPPVDVAAIMKEAREAQAQAQKASEALAAELRERDREDRRELYKRLEKAEAKPAEDPLASIKNGMELMKSMKDLFKPGGDDEEKNGREPWYADILRAAVPAIAPIVGLAAHAAAKYLGSTPQPQPQAAGTLPNPQPPQPTQEVEMNRESIIWNFIGAKLQHDYLAGKSGIDFACWLIEQTHLGLNQAVYAQLAGLGRDAVLVSMQTYAPMVWQQVATPDGKAQEGFEVFLAEFLDQKAVAAARSGVPEPPQQQEPAREPDEVIPAAGPRRVRRTAPGAA